MTFTAGPWASRIFTIVLHGLTAVAINCRPFGPRDFLTKVIHGLTALAINCRPFGPRDFLTKVIHGLTAVAINCRPFGPSHALFECPRQQVRKGVATVDLAVVIVVAVLTVHSRTFEYIQRRRTIVQARLLRIVLICGLAIASASSVWPQTRGKRPRNPSQPAPTARPRPPTTPEKASLENQEPQEVLKTDTSLVTVPVIALTPDGTYVSDLTKSEFTVMEDGVQQDVAFFATVTAPFHVVLVLDTSASTRGKLSQIRRAAIAFVEQLQSTDRVKVISFDDTIRDLNEFTNDRTLLRSAINKTASGQGTKVYDAVELALTSLWTVEGRKAIVLFSDGMDWHSDHASFDGTLRVLEETGIVFYPIRYETRAETERLAREQANEQTIPQLPTREVINRRVPGTIPPTFPSEDRTIPTGGQPKTTGPLGLPPVADILRGPRAERERDREGTVHDPRSDRPQVPTRPIGHPSEFPEPVRVARPPMDDSISALLDRAYLTADTYLNALADKSGGRLVRADTLDSLPSAFAKIAAELRTQYAIGYYPTNKERDGKFRKIKVSSTRKGVALRARPGYRAPQGG